MEKTRAQLDVLTSTSRHFRDYWFTRCPCKATRNAGDLHVLVMHIGEGLCIPLCDDSLDKAFLDTDDKSLAKALVARRNLHEYKDRVQSMLAIPGRAGVDKESYRVKRAEFVATWHALSEAYSWDAVTARFPSLAPPQ